MVGDLYINGVDVYAFYKVSMGDGFMDILRESLPMKPLVESKSRNMNGKKFVIPKSYVPKVDERDITLVFTVEGSTRDEFIENKNQLLSMFYAGESVIHVPRRGKEYYHVFYTGKSISYAENTEGTFCKISSKFCEPDPSFRTEK